MIPEIGHFALILALTMAVSQSVLPLIGAANGNAAWIALARPSARAQFLFMLVSYACLTWAFMTDDFSVALAANHSNSMLPAAYKFTAVWGNHEGSILLWSLILAGWTFAVTQFSRSLDDRTQARVLGVMGLVSCGFLLFTLLTSNPFERLLPAAPDGRDLNPLLQDPGMVIHPPMLYMGYVGFVVAFAFAIAALLSGRLDAAWARWSRPWTTVAWCFLTMGIALGSFWAYYELGWGGWWFWDPVENASFMPWLVGTALIHSLAVTEKRGGFKMWTALLAILAFSLSLLGTFIVRSGVLSSVHAFATDPARGIFILGFLVLVVGGSLLLFAWRAPKVGLGGSFDLVSRESMLLANNVLLVVAAGAVLLGTLYPLVLDALGIGKISVGPPYFDAVFVPLMAPAIFLMGIGPIARWRSAQVGDLARKLRWAIAVSALSAVVAPFVLGKWTPMIGFGLVLGVWVASSVVAMVWLKLHEQPLARWRQWMAQQPGSWYGMLLAHFGMAVFIFGVTVVSSFQVEKDLRMAPGESTEIAGMRVRFEGVREVRGPNYVAARGTLQLTRDDRSVATLYPERRTYLVSRMPMTETAIDRGFTRDLYISLGEPLDGGAWSVRVYYKPLVGWIWGGCALMTLGGLLAVLDRRYRAQRRVAAPQPAPAAGGGDGSPAMAREAGAP